MFHQLFGLPPYWVWVAAQRASLCSIANHPSVPTCASVSPPSAAVVKGGRRPTPHQRRLALDQREHGGTLGAVGTEGIGLSVNPKPQGDHPSHRRKARTQVTHVKQRSSPLLSRSRSSGEFDCGRVLLPGTKDHFMCAFGTPAFQPALQGPEQPARIIARLSGLQLFEQLPRRSPGFGLEPRPQLRGHVHQWIGAAPAALCRWLGS